MMNFELVSVSPERYEQYLAALKSGKTQTQAMEAIGFTGEDAYATTTEPFPTKRDSNLEG
jgi:cytochrome c oxidase subunit 2